MSWHIINEVLGLAATNELFAQELITDPLQAVRKHGYQLTVAEQEAFQMSVSQTLDVFSQNLLLHLSQVTRSHGREQEAYENEQ
jgi:hypothetical protein